MAATDKDQPSPIFDLKSLIEDLVYPSEDDRPFDIIDWPEGPLSAHIAPTATKLTPADFFDPLRDTTDANRFDALHQALAAHLSDLAAYRVSDGSAEVSLFVVGRLPDGRWAGVHTTSVET